MVVLTAKLLSKTQVFIAITRPLSFPMAPPSCARCQQMLHTLSDLALVSFSSACAGGVVAHGSHRAGMRGGAGARQLCRAGRRRSPPPIGHDDY